ncbi:MAG: hypothetical protein JNK82_43945 [Myxococcaceae bacterium]|nr:hypothetical protein [Myxococcaceae bacterium]
MLGAATFTGISGAATVPANPTSSLVLHWVGNIGVESVRAGESVFVHAYAQVDVVTSGSAAGGFLTPCYRPSPTSPIVRRTLGAAANAYSGPGVSVATSTVFDFAADETLYFGVCWAADYSPSALRVNSPGGTLLRFRR